MEQDSKIFVAGHRGLVGSAIARRLLGQGYGNLVTRSHGELDLTNQSSVNGMFEKEKPEYVFVAAARVGGIHANMTFPANFIGDNLMIQTNIINAAYTFGVKKLLFLGSSCIYPRLAPQPMKEDCLLTGPLESTNEWYAVAKIAGIKMCQAFRKQYGFNAISAMPTNLYGPHDRFDLENSHVLPALIRKFHLAKMALDGDFDAIEKDAKKFGPIPEDILRHLDGLASGGTAASITIWGTGTPMREFLHVDDLADACVFLMLHYDSDEIINVGVGEELSIAELAEIIRKAVGFAGRIEFDSSKPDGTPRKLLDVSRIFSLGWRPRIGLDEGIRRTYEWYVKGDRAGCGVDGIRQLRGAPER